VASGFELKPIYLPSSKLAGIGGAHGALEAGKPLGHFPVLTSTRSGGSGTGSNKRGWIPVEEPKITETETEIITTTKLQKGKQIRWDRKPVAKNKDALEKLSSKQKEIVADIPKADRNDFVPLIGKKVGKDADTAITLPKGYFWYKRSDGSLTIIRENDKLPQLVVQKEKGKDAILTVKASGETLEGFDPRISGSTSRKVEVQK
jgi:hypothetical protein